MSKSTQIQGKGYTPFINGEVVKRVQSLDWSTDLGVENIQELGNASFVEKKSDVPKISVSFETNDVGNMALLNLFKTGKRLTGSGSNSGAQITQSVASAGTTQLDIYKVDTASTGLFSNAVGTMAWTNSGGGTVTVTMNGTTNDLDESTSGNGALCPSMIVKVSEHNNTTVNRTCHMQGLYIDSIDFAYDVGGMAKENLRMSGDHKEWFLNDYKNANISMATFVDASSVVTDVAGTTASSADVVAVYCNKELIFHRGKVTGTAPIEWNASGLMVWTTAADTGANNGAGFASGDRVEVVFKDDNGAFPRLGTVNTGTLGGLRRGAVEIYLKPSSVSTDFTKMLRCQSVSGSLNFGRQDVFELGTQRYIDRPLTYPLDVKFDLTFNDCDLQALGLIQDKDYAGTGDYLDIKDMAENSTVVVVLYNNEYTHTGANVLKTITMTTCKAITDGDSARIGNSAGQWKVSMQTDNIVWQGKITN